MSKSNIQSIDPDLVNVCSSTNAYADLTKKIKEDSIRVDQVVKLFDNVPNCSEKVKETKRDQTKAMNFQDGIINLALAHVDRNNDKNYIDQAEMVYKTSQKNELLTIQIDQVMKDIDKLKNDKELLLLKEADRNYESHKEPNVHSESHKSEKKPTLSKQLAQIVSYPDLSAVRSGRILQIILYSLFIIIFSVLSGVSFYWYNRVVKDEEEYDHVNRRKNMWLWSGLISLFVILVLLGILIYTIVKLVRSNCSKTKR
jgi:uncharacterized membrane protein